MFRKLFKGLIGKKGSSGCTSSGADEDEVNTTGREKSLKDAPPPSRKSGPKNPSPAKISKVKSAQAMEQGPSRDQNAPSQSHPPTRRGGSVDQPRGPTPPPRGSATPMGSTLTIPMDSQDNEVLDDMGNTLLHASAFEGDIKTVAAILRSGETVDKRNNLNATPLHAAAAGTTLDIIQVLLTAGADPNALSTEGRSALSEAALVDNSDVLAKIFATGKVTAETANCSDLDTYTPLHLAAMQGHAASVATLLQSPLVDRTCQSRQGLTAFHMAVLKGHWQTVKIFAALGMDVNVRTSRGETIVHLAVRSGKAEETLKGVLTMVPGLDLSVTDEDGYTALMRAVATGDKAKVRAVLDTGKAAVNTLNPKSGGDGQGTDEDDLHMVCMLKFADTGTGALAKRGTPEHRKQVRESIESSFASSALHLAAANGVEWAVHDLVEKGGADPEIVDSLGRKPLHVAVFGGHRRIVKYLVEQMGAEVESREAVYGFSALSIAAFSVNPEMVGYLLHRADSRVNPRAHDGSTPYTIASDAMQALKVERSQSRGRSMDLAGFDEEKDETKSRESSPIRSAAGLTGTDDGSTVGPKAGGVFKLPSNGHVELSEDTAATSAAAEALEFVLPAPSARDMRVFYAKDGAAAHAAGKATAGAIVGRAMRASVTTPLEVPEEGEIPDAADGSNPSPDDPDAKRRKNRRMSNYSQKSVEQGTKISFMASDMEDLVPGTVPAAEFVLSLLADKGGRETRIDDARLFFQACASGTVEQVRLLLRWVDVNVRESSSGRSGVHVAVAGTPTPGHVEVLKALLAVPGLDLHATDASGKTALDLATNAGSQEVLDLLSRAVAQSRVR